MDMGDKIRKLRLSKGMTQEDVASRADLARSFISQVESDKTSPTVDNLERIIKAVGSSLNAFFSDYSDEKIVYKKDDRVPLYDMPPGINIKMLMDEIEDKELDAYYLLLEPNAETDVEDYHNGDEFGFLISGTLSLFLDDKVYRLEEGDCFYFKADKKHHVKNTSEEFESRLLWIKFD